MAIPISDGASGFSSAISNQLKAAPETGIRNFQTLRRETFTPGRFKIVFQMVNAAADKKLSQANAYQYFGGKGPR